MLKRTFPLALALLIAATMACDDEPTVPQTATFVAELSGDAEVPPVQTTAEGLATFTVRGSTVDFTITVTDIQDATAAHIHDGQAGENGDILVPLFAGSFSGSGTLVTGSFDASDIQGGVSYDALVGRFEDESLYVNVHTQANLPGEIRGQIVGPVAP